MKCVSVSVLSVTAADCETLGALEPMSYSVGFKIAKVGPAVS